MDEEALNISIRKFLKMVGVSSQRDIEHAVAQAIERGELAEVQTGVAPAARRLALVVHRERRLGRGADAFVRHCFAAVKEQRRAR